MDDDLHILSYALDNVPNVVLEAQAKVFAKFGIPLLQRTFEWQETGGWIWFKRCIDEVDRWIESQSGSIIVVDVDCIPLSRECITDIYLPAIRSGAVIGPAQRCVAPEWCETQKLVYAGPAMLGFSSDT